MQEGGVSVSRTPTRPWPTSRAHLAAAASKQRSWMGWAPDCRVLGGTAPLPATSQAPCRQLGTVAARADSHYLQQSLSDCPLFPVSPFAATQVKGQRASMTKAALIPKTHHPIRWPREINFVYVVSHT